MGNETWNIVSWLHNQEGSWAILVLTFFVSQLVNVILSTIRSVVLIKGGKRTAILFNVLSYTISAFVTALIAGVITNVPIVIIITAITNAIGVWIGLTLVDKMRKEQLWRISATVKTEFYKLLVDDLKENNIKFVTFETDWEKVHLIDVFSQGREQSDVIHKIFDKYNVKYTINTNSHIL